MAVSHDNNKTAELNETEVQKYREAWRLFDTKDTGYITLDEFKEILNSLGINAAENEVLLRLSKVDSRNNGVINFDEFMKVVTSDKHHLGDDDNETNPGAEMVQMFKIFDPSNKGYVTKVELGEVLKKLGLPFTQQQLDLMMEYADTAGDGRINYSEFLKMNKVSY